MTNKDFFRVLNKQINGTHYKKLKIQPATFINENKIFIDYQEIKNIIINNNELKSLRELVEAASFNLSSKMHSISKYIYEK